MKRMELIANRSVEKEIIEALENEIQNFYYTLLPEIFGRGKKQYRLGTAIWPETNFLLIAYLDDQNAAKALNIVRQVKEQFPEEGIKLFMMDAVV